MSRLAAEIEANLQPGMVLPEPLKLLFAWIESNGYFEDTDLGVRVGFLYPRQVFWNRFSISESEDERHGGTDIEFAAEGNDGLHYWLGHSNPAVLNRLCVFGKTGFDGSKAAFWLAPDGTQKIVHLGSGSGPGLVCVLADDAVDFLRLLAIGYDEICQDHLFAHPPNTDPRDTFVHPNMEFQRWVCETFHVSIPRVALEIVAHPSRMGDPESQDPFWRWLEEYLV
jgi:hypothetical protein